MALGPDSLTPKVVAEVKELEAHIDAEIEKNFRGNSITIYLKQNPMEKTKEILREKYMKAGWTSVSFDSHSSVRDESSSVMLSTIKTVGIRSYAGDR